MAGIAEVPCILESLKNEMAFMKNWARLIKKIYEVDPIVYPKCQGLLRLISSIEDPVIQSSESSSIAWASGSSSPDHHRKLMSHLLPISSRMMFINCQKMTIIFIDTPNIAATTTFSHDAPRFMCVQVRSF